MTDSDEVLAGIYRVEASNDRTNHIKVHRPILGPYTSTNPKSCADCHKLLAEVRSDEACP